MLVKFTFTKLPNLHYSSCDPISVKTFSLEGEIKIDSFVKLLHRLEYYVIVNDWVNSPIRSKRFTLSLFKQLTSCQNHSGNSAIGICFYARCCSYYDDFRHCHKMLVESLCVRDIYMTVRGVH